MSWLILVVSALFEAVWATALSRLTSWTDFGAIALLLGGMTVSLAGLAWAMREIPVGTAYAVWVGIGAATTAGYAWYSGAQPFSIVQAFLILGIVACVIGLRLTQ